MNKILLTGALLFGSGLAAVAQITVSGAGGAITDATEFASSVTPFTINVSDTTLITKLNSITLNGLTHGWASDLNISLSHNGTKVILAEGFGGGGNYNGTYTFDDISSGQVGAGFFEDADDIPQGTYHAEDFDGLTFYNGYIGTSMAGLWTLEFEDTGEFDAGSFGGWSITFNDGNTTPAPDPNAVPEPGALAMGAVLGLSLAGLVVKRRRNAAI